MNVSRSKTLILATLVALLSFARISVAEDRLAAGEHFADLGDVRLWYKVAGKGPYLVVSSVNWGAGTGYLQHPEGISPLERDFTLIYVNSRGTPPSSRPADATQMSTSIMVDDLERLRRYWNLPTLDLTGHSGGAMIALGYAERYPAQTCRLILLDGIPLDDYPSPRTKEILDSWRMDPRYEQAIAREKGSVDPPTDAGFAQYLGDILPLYFHYPARFLPVFKQTLSYQPSYWVARHNGKADEVPMPQSKQLGRVTAKTLIIVGRYDFVCPVESSEQMARGIAGSKLVIFEQTGHMPWIEERDRFFKVVRDFMHATR